MRRNRVIASRNVIFRGKGSVGIDVARLPRVTLTLPARHLNGRHGSTGPAEGQPVGNQMADSGRVLAREVDQSTGVKA
jgi:hypothetical protein